MRKESMNKAFHQRLGIWVAIISLAYVLGGHATTSYKEKPFVVVIPSYNNKRWYKQNLDSVLSQKYTNYRIVYIDDASTDGTGRLVQEYLKQKGVKDKVTFMQNKKNEGALYNWYHAVHSCKDEEIIISLDGDDQLAHPQVLSVINSSYQNLDVWLTYGQYQEMPRGNLGGCCKFPEEVIKHNTFRKHPWMSSHLRTFYAWLFKKIKKEDLQENGKFFTAAADVAQMIPMLEMAGNRHRCIREVLYKYNVINTLNVWRANKASQSGFAQIIAERKPYSPLVGIPKEIRI